MMDDPKHTPGPWQSRHVAGAGLGIYGDVRATMGDRFTDLVEIFGLDACQPPRFQIAYERWVQFPKREWDEMQRANAQLMAAAPSMLQTLSRMDGWLREGGFAEDHPWRISLRESIEAATTPKE
jgi:hypothetical protein